MGNRFTSKTTPGSIEVDMNNGLTSVFFDVLAIAGSDRAKTTWEKKLVYWLVEHDQARIGSGVVGFDVVDMGWTREDFAGQKSFVNGVIDDALARHGWDRLSFSPREDWVFEKLAAFRDLVNGFSIDAIEPMDDERWLPNELPDHGICDTHRVYLHETGCIVCNDA